MKRTVRIRCAVAICVCLCLLLSSVPFVGAEESTDTPALSEETALPVCYQQGDPRWGEREQLAPGGCGILSLVNAVHFLTGNFINPVELAAYARSIDAYYGSVGGGTARWVLYHQLEDYEKKYGFDVVQTGKDAGAKHTMLLEHLAAGGTAVAHVKGHFIALCGYDAATDSILVYDCAATPDRGTTVEPSWKTTDFLSTHARMTVDWWCLIQRTGDTTVTVEGVSEEGRNRELYPTVRSEKGTKTLTLEGTVKHSDRVASLFYVLDYDLDHPVELTDATLKGGRSATFSATVDTGEWSLGQHILRLSARTETGCVVDIAEYTVFVSDGGDGYDSATGTLVVNMSGFSGQKGVVANSKALHFDGYAFRSDPESVLYLGRLDLSKYTAVRFYYSVRDSFFGDNAGLVGLRSSATSFGFRDSEAELTDGVAWGEIPAADYPLSTVQTVTVDLSDCDYDGELWLSVYHPKRQYFYLREIRFYTGEVPPAEEPTVETETVTESDTDALTEIPSDEGTATEQNGCAATLAGGFLPAATVAAGAAVGVLTLAERGRCGKKKGRKNR